MSSPRRQTVEGQQTEKSMGPSAISPLPKPPRSPGSSSSLTGSSPQTPSSPISFDFRNVINSQDLLEIAACPCCKQCIDDRKQQTLSGPRMADPYSCLGDDDGSIDSDDEETLPQGVAEGLKYQPKRILVEGLLHKKGTGNDWMGSKSWKPRWARLVMAKLEGFEVDVPLMMIYWYSGTSTPSNVIILDSTVAFPIDLDDKERWDAFRFDVRNARTVTTNSTVNRTFCAPKKARDTWIYAISQALLIYEKANDKARKAAIKVSEARRVTPQPMLCRPMSPPFEEVWSGDRFVSPGKGSPPRKSPPRAPSPPSSPRSRNAKSRSIKRSIPRPASPQLPKASS